MSVVLFYILIDHLDWWTQGTIGCTDCSFAEMLTVVQNLRGRSTEQGRRQAPCRIMNKTKLRMNSHDGLYLTVINLEYSGSKNIWQKKGKHISSYRQPH